MSQDQDDQYDWSQLLKSRREAIWSFLGLPIGMGLAVIGGGLHYWLLVPIGIALIFTYFGLINRLQQCPCPKYGNPFPCQINPLMGWAVFSILAANRCSSCGLERP